MEESRPLEQYCSPCGEVRVTALTPLPRSRMSGDWPIPVFFSVDDPPSFIPAAREETG